MMCYSQLILTYIIVMIIKTRYDSKGENHNPRNLGLGRIEFVHTQPSRVLRIPKISRGENTRTDIIFSIKKHIERQET